LNFRDGRLALSDRLSGLRGQCGELPRDGRDLFRDAEICECGFYRYRNGTGRLSLPLMRLSALCCGQRFEQFAKFR
jgi:hypothetical protein